MGERLGAAYICERLEYKLLIASKSAYQWARGRPPMQVVFVAGMQRSGTNMLMDRLERSYLTDVYHERDPRAFDNYRMRDRDVIRRLVANSRAPTFVIKALCELDRLTALMDEFAPAKTVWIVRDYRDAVRSALVSFGNFTKQVARIAADRMVDDWRAGGMSQATHEIVRGMWHPAMSEASAAALIWYFRNILFFEQVFERDPRVRLVSYERLVEAPQQECGAIFAFLGVPWSERVTRGVFASSVHHHAMTDIEPAIAQMCDELAHRLERVRKLQSAAGGA